MVKDGEGLSFDYHKHHAFLFPLVHVRRVGSQIAYSEDDNVNSVAPRTSSEAGGTKADQEELQGHHPKKNMQNHRKPWVALLVVGSITVVNPAHIEELRVMSKHVQPCPCHSY